ncbi:hypothetical protein PC116_g27539 [Phytophthora cactorum]|nr:hypothetical protein PC119_g24686 [Phytophthora cactorum]KAG4038024.1 hypothetical protein PC123_g26413 [Phytophthora cactorum]KAG4224003.1 hypothetical protein PC116_g27539 [Phytophthora cactorum]
MINKRLRRGLPKIPLHELSGWTIPAKICLEDPSASVHHSLREQLDILDTAEPARVS